MFRAVGVRSYEVVTASGRYLRISGLVAVFTRFCGEF